MVYKAQPFFYFCPYTWSQGRQQQLEKLLVAGFALKQHCCGRNEINSVHLWNDVYL